MRIKNGKKRKRKLEISQGRAAPTESAPEPELEREPDRVESLAGEASVIPSI